MATKWEYKTVHLPIPFERDGNADFREVQEFDSTLNKLGEDGWELFSTEKYVREKFGPTVCHYFKRPKSE